MIQRAYGGWASVAAGLCAAALSLVARADPIDDLMAEPALRGARVSVVVGLEDGTEIFARNPTRPMVPASSLKVLTAAAALARFGPAYRFETPVMASGPLDADGVLKGDLWVVGRGDPALVSEELWRLGEELRLLGLREVQGALGIDSSYFDAVRFHPDWARASRRAYEAPVAAFSANYSSFRVEVAAGKKVGEPLRLGVAPEIPYFSLAPAGRTLNGRARVTLSVEPRADGAGEVVRAEGFLSPDHEPQTFWRSVAHPESYAGSLLRAQLAAHGIRVHGGLRAGHVPDDARELLRFRGENLGRIVWKLNKFSNNFIAEQLTKALGATRFGPPGSWSKGVDALVEHLEAIGGLPPGERIADGSGLSPHNRLSARTLFRLMVDAARRFESGPEFVASLPLGGLDGTLEQRMAGATPVRAKTGHLDGVSALCGMVPAREEGGRRLFALLVNGGRGSAEEVDASLDRFVASVAETAVAQGAVGE